MKKMDLKKVLATNLRVAMTRKYHVTNCQSALSRDTDNQVDPKTISNILSANKYDAGDPRLKDVPAASITVLSLLASALNMDVWELLHPGVPELSSQAIKVGKAFEQLGGEAKGLILKQLGVEPEPLKAETKPRPEVSKAFARGNQLNPTKKRATK